MDIWVSVQKEDSQFSLGASCKSSHSAAVRQDRANPDALLATGSSRAWVNSRLSWQDRAPFPASRDSVLTFYSHFTIFSKSLLKQSIIQNKIISVILKPAIKTSVCIVFTKLNTQTSGKAIVLFENKPLKALEER